MRALARAASTSATQVNQGPFLSGIANHLNRFTVYDSSSIVSLRLSRAVKQRASETQPARAVRLELTKALNDSRLVRQLWGQGCLGQMFPEHFGHYSEHGGIVGRPQHSGHEFSLDTHVLLVMDRVRAHAKFDELSFLDQENLLLAAMLHDIAKKALILDPEHEQRGAHLSRTLLAKLCYSKHRIQQVATIISRHTEVSYMPGDLVSTRLSDDQDALEDIATHYKTRVVLAQLRILNESDIKSISSDSAFWTPEVESELSLVEQMISNKLTHLRSRFEPNNGAGSRANS